MKKHIMNVLLVVLMLASIFGLTACIPEQGHPPHEWSEWETITPSTCQAPGTAERYCDCGETQTKSLPIANHVESDWIIDEEATCLADGSKHKECTACHKNLANEKIEKVDHNYGEWIDEVPATIEKEGTLGHYHCSVCEKNFDANKNELNSIVIPKLGNEEPNPDPEPHKHTESDWIIDKGATCTENGSKHKKCIECEEKIITEVIYATGHSFSSKWSKDKEYHWHDATCGHNDAKSGYAIHNFDSDGICIVCEYQQKTKLEAPEISTVLYDVVNWSAVENATNYTITVNGDYTYTTASLSASIAYTTYEGRTITTPGPVSIVVCANGDGKRYETSENSSVFYDYYVPEKTSLSDDESKLYDYGIGYGYNLLENAPIDPEKISHFKVLNINKLLTLGEYYNPSISSGKFESKHFSSIEELQLHLDASLDKSNGVSLPIIGSLKKQLSLSGGVDYAKYDFNETYTVRQDYIHRTYGIKNYDVDLLIHCLTETFINDIALYQSKGEEEWLKYMCSKYGTHVILGIATGAYYDASYTISTNKTDIAAKIKFEFERNSNLSITDILGLDLGLDISLDANGKWSKEETEASFNINWKGSNGGGTTSPQGLDSAIARFESGVENNAVPIRFTTDGAISIGTLISMVEESLGQKFENYINSKADEEFKALYSQYTKPSTLPLTIENINGQNVLTVDLSKYQSSGSIDNVYNTNLLNGVLTVYPKMIGKTVDKIVVTGGFNEHPNSLINGFSIKLAKGWNKDIDIVVDNLGVICSYDKGLVDRSDVSSVYVIGLEYTGNNLIKYGDKTLFCTSSNDKIYNFDLMLGDNETLDTSTIQIGSNIRLPITIKDGGYQFAGWYDTNGSAVTDNKGYILDDYVIIGAIAHISPKYIKASEGLEYTINDDYASYSVIGIGSCTDKDITIPDTYNGLPVTKIGNNAFIGLNSINSVSISNSVTSIGDGAFADCTSLESVVIGDSVTTIGNYAFYYCRSLKDVYISDVKAWLNIEFCNDFSYPTISGAALHILDGNGNEVTNLIIPDGVINIPIRAFFGCYNLTSITMPDSVTTIGDYAFTYCLSLTNITIPDNVTTIGDGAFGGCLSLTSVTVDENNKYYKHIDGNLYTKDEKTLVQYASGKKSTSFVIPDNVTTIGDYAFTYCLSLTNITISDNVTTIGDGAFGGCSSLTSVVIPDNVTTIGDKAFWGCSSLTSVVIGDSVTTIGEEAFSFSSLADVYYTGTKQEWDAISIGSSNYYLTSATIHYNYVHKK